MNAFQPVGAVPRWRVLYALLKPLGAGDVIEYGTMCRELGIPESARHIVQGAVRRAAKEFAVHDNHALEAVPNVGYRVVRAEEHLVLARQHQVRSERALGRGRSNVVHVDLTGADPEVRKAFDTVAQAFAVQQELIRRLDVRQANLERTMAATEVRTEHTDSELAALRDRLDRLERRRTDAG